VEKAAELGVTRLVPLVTARSVARVGGKALTRLRRTVVEASKQCGRNRLMQIGEPQAWSDFLEATQAVPVRLVAHPAERSRDTAETGRFAEGEAPTAWRGSPSVVAAVGPEGGFTQEELARAASARWRVVDLGPRTLRTETAAIALSAMVAMGAIGEGFWGKG
jgi:16S rRNA (uracil1498-N3)-methyltransferase